VEIRWFGVERIRGRGVTRALGSASAIDPAFEPVDLTVPPPEEALRREADPDRRRSGDDGLTDAEWTAFETALTTT
jgi:hypothetical protein